jgi:hypothetical protein
VHTQRITGISALRRAIPALVVTALAVSGAAASGQAAAAPHGSAVAAAPVISTVAGGVGGPAKATTVALGSLCGLS